MKKKKKSAMLLLLAAALAIVLAGCSLPFMPDQSKKTVENPKFQGGGTPSAENSGQEGSADDIGSETISLSLDQLLKYADSSSSMWELVQRFTDEVIIYKDSLGRYRYEPVNKDLPLSDYDFSNLVKPDSDSKLIEYVENGETVSIKGIDVSKYQGDIEWDKVAADGVRFAFIRLGYRGYETGKLVLDEKFEDNITGALENGIEVGVYFLTQAVSAEEGREEAEFVLQNIAPYRVNWPVALDMEETSGSNPRTLGMTAEQRTDAAVAFCEAVKEKGYKPMLYSHIRWFIEELELERLSDYNIWFAQYFNRPFFPYAFQVWQYSNTGKIDGIKGNVDLNMSFVDFAPESAGAVEGEVTKNE